MRIYLAHSSAFNFREKLYEPIRGSELDKEHTFFLPQETGKEEVTRDLIKSCGLVIAEVSLPSTGEGIELGWADMYDVSIICIYEKGAHYSSSLNYVTQNFFEYESPEDMLSTLSAFLSNFKDWK